MAGKQASREVFEVGAAMDLNLRKEQFSNAYVCAVVATAGFQISKPYPDIDKTDWIIAAPGPKKTIRSPMLGIQLKCTSREVIHGDAVHYAVDLETYDSLRDPTRMVPVIIVVVVVPGNVHEWLDHSEHSLSLLHCGYWTTLRDMPPTDNQTQATIQIPRPQQFTTAEVSAMMERVGAGGFP